MKTEHGIPNNSCIIFDDYIHLFLNKNDHLAKFQNLIYVEASHRFLTIFFGIQSTLKNNLLSYIISSNYIFLTYCTANKRFLQQFYPALNEHYKTHFSDGVQKYDIALLDTRRERLYPAFNRLLLLLPRAEDSGSSNNDNNNNAISGGGVGGNTVTNTSTSIGRNSSSSRTTVKVSTAISSRENYYAHIFTMFEPDTRFYLVPAEEFSLYAKDEAVGKRDATVQGRIQDTNKETEGFVSDGDIVGDSAVGVPGGGGSDSPESMGGGAHISRNSRQQEIGTFLNDISFNGKKKLKPTTHTLALKLFKFSKNHNILFMDCEGHFYLKTPKSTVLVYAIDLISIFQSTSKNNLFMKQGDSLLLPEVITIISFLRKNNFGASRGLVTNKEVYGRLMYPKSSCPVYWKHPPGCTGGHGHRDSANRIDDDDDETADANADESVGNNTGNRCQNTTTTTVIDYRC